MDDAKKQAGEEGKPAETPARPSRAAARKSRSPAAKAERRSRQPAARPSRTPGRHRTVLITGIGRQIGRIVAKRLDRSFDVIGIGQREWVGSRPESINASPVALERNLAEDYFRRQPIDTVVHLEYVHSPRMPAEERHRINVVGTMRILDFCHKYRVKKVVILSTAHIYGALHDNHPYLDEEDPVRAGQDYAALRHMIEIDTYARSWMYRFRDVKTVILRPCNIIGPTIRNSMTRYLGRTLCPTLLGFDPMMQFVHEEDLAEAVALAVERPGAAGILNVAGDGVIPLSHAVREAGGRCVPFPHPLVYASVRLLWPLGLTALPSPEIDYLMYSCIVSTRRAGRELGFRPRYSLLETLRSVRAGRR